MTCPGNDVMEGGVRTTLIPYCSTGQVNSSYYNIAAANNSLSCCFVIWKGGNISGTTFSGEVNVAYDLNLTQTGVQQFPYETEIGSYEDCCRVVESLTPAVLACGCSIAQAQGYFQRMFPGRKLMAVSQGEMASAVSSGMLGRTPAEHFYESLASDVMNIYRMLTNPEVSVPVRRDVMVKLAQAMHMLTTAVDVMSEQRQSPPVRQEAPSAADAIWNEAQRQAASNSKAEVVEDKVPLTTRCLPNCTCPQCDGSEKGSDFEDVSKLAIDTALARAEAEHAKDRFFGLVAPVAQRKEVDRLNEFETLMARLRSKTA